MSNITALQEIRQDKKALEEMITESIQAFEDKYPGFKIEGMVSGHCELRGDYYGKFDCTLQIKIPWL